MSRRKSPAAVPRSVVASRAAMVDEDLAALGDAVAKAQVAVLRFAHRLLLDVVVKTGASRVCVVNAVSCGPHRITHRGNALDIVP
jgi:hypothetical protein